MKLLLLLLVSLAAGQIFTCKDGVTLCLVGVETCCCPPAALCLCCEASEVCVGNTTCLVPSATPSGTPSASTTPSGTPSASTTPTASPTPTGTPSPTLAPVCMPLSTGAVTCRGPLGSVPVVLSANTTVIDGDLEMSSESVLVLGAPVTVQSGTAAVAGVVQVRLDAVELTGGGDGQFVSIITVTDGALVVDQNTTVEVLALPDADAECEQVLAGDTQQRGTQFGVLLTVDSSECASGDDGGVPAAAIIVPVAAAGMCVLLTCVVCAAVVLGMVYWNRVRFMLYKHEDTDVDQVVNKDSSRAG